MKTKEKKFLTSYMKRSIYQEALEALKHETDHIRAYELLPGLCWAIYQGLYMVLKLNGEIDPYKFSNMREYFPEVAKHKPPDSPANDGYWFPRNKEGYEKRLQILKDAIQEMDKLLEESGL